MGGGKLGTLAPQVPLVLLCCAQPRTTEELSEGVDIRVLWQSGDIISPHPF